MKSTWGWLRFAAVMVLMAAPAMAQSQVGDNVNLTMNGEMMFGYSNSYSSDNSVSSHNLLLGGTGQFNGYYYNPNFISFSAQPYYNRSQDNSTYQSLSNSLGFTSQVNIFSGSHFPGTFGYTQNDNAMNSLGLAGSQGLATDSKGRSWNLTWSALMPKLPTLTVSFIKAQADASIYGTDAQSSSQSSNLNIRSSYNVAGFTMHAAYLRTTTGMNTPLFLTTESIFSTTDNTNDSEQYDVSHRLPMRGFFSASAMRFHNVSDFSDEGIESTTHTYTSTASFLPWKPLTFSTGMYYTDNLSGALNQSLLQQGAAPVFMSGGKSDSLNVYGNATVQVYKGLAIAATANHVVQHWGGIDYSTTQFGGTASYSYTHSFLGSFTFSGGAVDTATETGNGGVGLVGNINFSRRFGHWETGAGFSYSQTVQTLAAVYTTSAYSYTADLRRKFGTNYWAIFFSGAHSGLQMYQADSHSETIGSSWTSRRFSVNGNWGQSAGMSIMTATGLVATPATVPISVFTPETVVLYNGSHYGIGGSTTLMKKMTIIGNYSTSNNSTIAGLNQTLGNTSMVNTMLRYPLRKLYFDAGYTRLNQSVTVLGGSPVVVSSYYFGVSRWFNLF